MRLFNHVLHWGAENAGPEIAGPENTEPKMSENAGANYTTGKCGNENAGPEIQDRNI